MSDCTPRARYVSRKQFFSSFDKGHEKCKRCATQSPMLLHIVQKLCRTLATAMKPSRRMSACWNSHHEPHRKALCAVWHAQNVTTIHSCSQSIPELSAPSPLPQVFATMLCHCRCSRATAGPPP
eukprot:6780105-Alexandrium_andersonii.AAC.2